MAMAIVLAIIVSGCGVRLQPVYNADQIPVPVALQDSSSSTVANIIKTSAINRGWRVEDVSPNVVRATLDNRTHEAVIDIHYSKTSYSIDYVSSKDLLYNGTQIHRNYNRWVKTLENDINKNLNLAAMTKS